MALATKKEREESLYFAVQFRFGYGSDDYDRALVEWCGFDEWEAMDSKKREAYIEEAVEQYACSEMNGTWVDDHTLISHSSGWQFALGDLGKVGAHDFMAHFLDSRAVWNEQLGREEWDDEEVPSGMQLQFRVFGYRGQIEGAGEGCCEIITNRVDFVNAEHWDGMGAGQRLKWLMTNAGDEFCSDDYLDSVGESSYMWLHITATKTATELQAKGYVMPEWEHDEDYETHDEWLADNMLKEEASLFGSSELNDDLRVLFSL